MKWFFCTRTKKEDYFTDWWQSVNDPDGAKICKDALYPLEGIFTSGRYCALIRERENCALVLSVSVSTNRTDFVGSPIRDFACLEAENPEDEWALVEYFSLVLQGTDSETIYKAESPFSRVFEDLYESRLLASFAKEFPGREKPGGGQGLEGRWEFPREDKAERLEASKRLVATVRGGKPFAIVMADQFASETVKGLKLQDMPVWIFSRQTKEKSALPLQGNPSDFRQRPSSKTKLQVIGGLAAILLIGLVVWPKKSTEPPGRSRRNSDTCETNSLCSTSILTTTNNLDGNLSK